MEPNTNNATTVMTKLLSLVENVMGNAESEKTKTRLHLVGTIFGGVAEEGASLLADKFDTNALLAGILRVENGLSDVEACNRSGKLCRLTNGNNGRASALPIYRKETS